MKDIDGMLDFFLYEKGKSIKINGIDQLALVTDVVDKLTYYNDKIIRCKCQITTGDLVEYNNLKYIIISQIDKNDTSNRARIRKCSATIAFNWAGNIKWFDCIEESNVFDVSSGKYMSLPTGSINIFVQNNADTQAVALNQRFYVTNQPFKITGIDKSQEGLLKLNCALDSISTTYDDVENNIYDLYRYENHDYILNINNGATATVRIGTDLQLNVLAYDNGIVMNPQPEISFISATPTVAMVENVRGIVMGKTSGSSIVTASMLYKSTIKASITVTVQP